MLTTLAHADNVCAAQSSCHVCLHLYFLALHFAWSVVVSTINFCSPPPPATTTIHLAIKCNCWELNSQLAKFCVAGDLALLHTVLYRLPGVCVLCL